MNDEFLFWYNIGIIFGFFLRYVIFPAMFILIVMLGWKLIFGRNNEG